METYSWHLLDSYWEFWGKALTGSAHGPISVGYESDAVLFGRGEAAQCLSLYYSLDCFPQKL